MAYLFLWSIVERYVRLRYFLKAEGVTKRIYKLAEEQEFCDALNREAVEKRTLQRADSPKIRETLDKSNPKKSINYYYQIRNNISHSGKGVNQDISRVEKSLKELFNIFKYVLEKNGLRS